MKTATIVFLVIWSILVFDSAGALMCKYIRRCANIFSKLSVGAQFPLGSWVFVYFTVAVLGMVTVLVMMKEDSLYA